MDLLGMNVLQLKSDLKKKLNEKHDTHIERMLVFLEDSRCFGLDKPFPKYWLMVHLRQANLDDLVNKVRNGEYDF